MCVEWFLYGLLDNLALHHYSTKPSRLYFGFEAARAAAKRKEVWSTNSLSLRKNGDVIMWTAVERVSKMRWNSDYFHYIFVTYMRIMFLRYDDMTRWSQLLWADVPLDRMLYNSLTSKLLFALLISVYLLFGILEWRKMNVEHTIKLIHSALTLPITAQSRSICDEKWIRDCNFSWHCLANS